MGQLRSAFRVISLIIVLQTLLTAQAVSPADPAFKAQFEEGQRALKAGRCKDAITILKKANKLQHNSCGVCYLLLAVAFYRSGELAQCEENCDKAAARATDDGMRAVAQFPTYLVIDGDGIIKERLTGLNPQQSVVVRLRSTLGQMPQLEGEAHK
jgi:hypothetical protein